MAGKVVRLKRQTLEPTETSLARQKATFFVCVALLLVAFVAGVRWVAATRNSVTSADISSAGLYYRISMKKSTYAPGEPIEITLFVTNISTDPIKLEFATNLELELTIEREQDIGIAQLPEVIWQLSKDSGHRQKPNDHSVTIEPGENKGFSGVWPQIDFRGNRVPSGRYSITGGLLAKNRTAVLRLHGTTAR